MNRNSKNPQHQHEMKLIYIKSWTEIPYNGGGLQISPINVGHAMTFYKYGYKVAYVVKETNTIHLYR